MFSDHNEIKLEVHNKKITGKHSNIWKLNKTPLNNIQIEDKSLKRD